MRVPMLIWNKQSIEAKTQIIRRMHRDYFLNFLSYAGFWDTRYVILIFISFIFSPILVKIYNRLNLWGVFEIHIYFLWPKHAVKITPLKRSYFEISILHKIISGRQVIPRILQICWKITIEKKKQFILIERKLWPLEW